MHELQADEVQRLGYTHRFFYHDEAVPPGTDVVLIQGPFGSLLPLTRQLVAASPAARPVLAYWFEESLDMQQPELLRRILSASFSELGRDALTSKLGRAGPLVERIGRRLLSTRGHRWRYLGDILWLHAHGLLDVLALSSTVYGEYLTRRGVPSVVVPRGYHPGYGAQLDLERDIAVVWMGQTRTKRRRQAVYWLRDELRQRGYVMQIHDGVDRGFIFGDERARILNRTRFVLNLFTQPADELSIRFYVAAASGAVVLTEPSANRYPFVSGQHWVECALEQMPSKVAYYLENEPEWQRLSRAMLAHMESDVTLDQSIARILDRAIAIRASPAASSHSSAAPSLPVRPSQA
jgi:hypothetical protein